MRTDHRIDIVDDELLRTVFTLDHLLQGERIFDAIAMRDGERLIGKRRGEGLFEVLEQTADALHATTRLLNRDQAPFVIDMQHGLDVQQAASERCRSRNASATVEEHEVIHREPVAHVQQVLAYPAGNFVDCLALCAQLCSVVDQKPLTERGGKRIDRDERAIGIILHQVVAEEIDRFIGSRKRAREAKVEHIVS